jgi:RNA polymerase sigma factor (sigma-70 family)
MSTQTLVEKYIPFANKLAYQKKRTLPSFIDIEELKSAAYLGLVEAASRYEENRGVSFMSYAYPRITGAIQDSLRNQSIVKNHSTVDLENIDPVSKHEQQESVEHILGCLNTKDKQVMSHYFIDDLSMKEIGYRFGVSEGRVSQMIKVCKDRIRERLLAA